MQIRCATCGRGVHVADTGALPPTCPHCKRAPVPDRLGRFEIVKLLAAGGMGEVYLGRHEDLETRVAIKLLPIPPGDDPTELRRRFWREARLTAAIDHPGVVQVLDLCEEDGRLYLVLELVAGRSLRSLLRDGPVTVDEARRITLSVARVVAAAHAQGVVHRDIKPENVMVMPDGTVRVLDFGLARALQDSEPLTHTGEILGTPEYMAPEQLLDTADATTPRTDVHALGVLAYELLTGRSPFAGQSMFQALKLVESLAPPPPSRERDGDVSFPATVDDVVLRALDKDANRRPADAAAFAAAFEAAWPAVAVATRAATGRRWVAPALTAAGIALGLWLGFWLGSVLGRAADSTARSDGMGGAAAAVPTLPPGTEYRANLEEQVRDLASGPWTAADGPRAGRLLAALDFADAAPRGDTAVAVADLLLRLGQPHRALPAIERAAREGVPLARPTAVACWFAAHAAVPMALELPPWLWQVDLVRRDRLLGEPVRAERHPALHAWQRFAAGDARTAWTYATGLADGERSAASALLLALCANRLCDVPAQRRGYVGEGLDGFDLPLCRALLDGPDLARRALDDLRRDAPPQFADRWFATLFATAEELSMNPALAGRMDALAEQAWLTGGGELAVVWNAGLQALMGQGAARASELLRQLAPVDLSDAPGGAMATVLALAHTEGLTGIDPLLAQAPDAAEAVPFLAFWRGLNADQRQVAQAALTVQGWSNPAPTDAVSATLCAIVAAHPDRRLATGDWDAILLPHAVDWDAVRGVIWPDASRFEGLMAPRAVADANATGAVRIRARAGVVVSEQELQSFAKELCRVPE